MTTKTIAERIADRFDNDGQNWTDDNGFDLEPVAESAATDTWNKNDSCIHRLKDGSWLVICDMGWDVLTSDGEQLVDSNGETWCHLDDDGEPDSWQWGR